jgi:hypothetical protein
MARTSAADKKDSKPAAKKRMSSTTYDHCSDGSVSLITSQLHGYPAFTSFLFAWTSSRPFRLADLHPSLCPCTCGNLSFHFTFVQLQNLAAKRRQGISKFHLKFPYNMIAAHSVLHWAEHSLLIRRNNSSEPHWRLRNGTVRLSVAFLLIFLGHESSTAVLGVDCGLNTTGTWTDVAP